MQLFWAWPNSKLTIWSKFDSLFWRRTVNRLKHILFSHFLFLPLVSINSLFYCVFVWKRPLDVMHDNVCHSLNTYFNYIFIWISNSTRFFVELWNFHFSVIKFGKTYNIKASFPRLQVEGVCDVSGKTKTFSINETCSFVETFST